MDIDVVRQSNRAWHRRKLLFCDGLGVGDYSGPCRDNGWLFIVDGRRAGFGCGTRADTMATVVDREVYWSTRMG